MMAKECFIWSTSFSMCALSEMAAEPLLGKLPLFLVEVLQGEQLMKINISTVMTPPPMTWYMH